MSVSPAEDGSAEPDYSGSNTYVRFDVPKLKIKRSWPGIKGKITTSNPSTMIVFFVISSLYVVKLSSPIEHRILHNLCIKYFLFKNRTTNNLQEIV